MSSVEVNVSRSQVLFTSLVSVDVQEDQLITQLLQDKLLLAPPSQCRGRRNTKGPSSLFFITSDLLRQKPLSPEEVPFSRKLSTSACPTHATFDLYRRQQSWETTPWPPTGIKMDVATVTPAVTAETGGDEWGTADLWRFSRVGRPARWDPFMAEVTSHFLLFHIFVFLFCNLSLWRYISAEARGFPN